MISICLVRHSVEGEPPPNFYWCGTPEDFQSMVTLLFPLGAENGVEIGITRLNSIKIIGDFDVILRSLEDGYTLNKVLGDQIIVELDRRLWREVIHCFLSVSFSKSHQYIDLDEHAVEEDANFIISSECNQSGDLYAG
jgi:hypothetical protein